MRSTSAIGAVQNAVVAFLGAILDAVTTVRRIDAAWRAGPIVTVVEQRSIVAFFGQLDLAVSTSPGLAAQGSALGVVR